MAQAAAIVRVFLIDPAIQTPLGSAVLALWSQLVRTDQFLDHAKPR
jgi:hypothetical protein